MQSVVLIGDSCGVSDRSRTPGPAKGDRHLIPLGLIHKPPSEGGSGGAGIDGADAHRRQQQPPARPAAAAAAVAAHGSSPSTPPSLPPPPAGPPVLVLFPATLDLAIFVSAPPLGETLVSALLTLLAIVGSRAWGWGMVSTTGLSSGVSAGIAVGLGVRSRPVGGWGFPALSMVGIALLGGGLASTALAFSLALSTLWRSGWWLYLQPECAPVLFMLSGVTADVAMGFLLASLLQIHRTPPRQQEQSAASTSMALPLPDESTATVSAHATPRVLQGEMWNAVTPPGLSGLRGRR